MPADRPTAASLIIPVYKNEGSIPELLTACGGLAASMKIPLEVVFVVDGSPDRCHEILEAELPKQPFRSQLCQHSTNFGSFAAIRTGLARATGDIFAVMAADLQEPIELVGTFFEHLSGSSADVTIGVREGRADPFVSSVSSRVFWGLYRRLVMPDIPPGGVDVFGCTRAVRDQLISLEERNSSLVGQLFWVGFRRVAVPYTRMVRRHGTSAWTFNRKLRYLFDSVYAFSDLPIRALKWIGGGSVAIATVISVVVFISRLLGRIDVEGYTPIILAIMFFGGLNALGLGLVGEYVWRTFENTKRRPLAITRTHRTFEGTPRAP